MCRKLFPLDYNLLLSFHKIGLHKQMAINFKHIELYVLIKTVVLRYNGVRVTVIAIVKTPSIWEIVSSNR